MLIKTKRFLIVLGLLPVLFSSQNTLPQSHTTTSAVPTQEMTIEHKQLADRAQILRAYFAKYNSPLQNHAQDFVDAADTYGIDWKLVPAITGVESTFGKHIPGGHHPATTSYNGWGWGVYGNKVLGFKSWRHGIFTVSEGLKKNYIDKGLTDPYSMNRIYASSPTWGVKVDHFMKDINKFAINYSDKAPQEDNLYQPKVGHQPKPTTTPEPVSISYFNFPKPVSAQTQALSQELNTLDYITLSLRALEATKVDTNTIKDNPDLLAVNHSNIENKTVAVSARLSF